MTDAAVVLAAGRRLVRCAGVVTVLELPQPPAGGPTLELAAGGRLVKLPPPPPAAGPAAHVVACAVARDGRGLAAALLALVAGCGGLAGCPRGVVVGQLAGALTDVAAQAEHR